MRKVVARAATLYKLMGHLQLDEEKDSVQYGENLALEYGLACEKTIAEHEYDFTFTESSGSMYDSFCSYWHDEA